MADMSLLSGTRAITFMVAAFTAAEIAIAEPGASNMLRVQQARKGTGRLTLSMARSLATYNPYGNARSAIILTDDGTNWSPWTTYTHGLYIGRC
jgi:hypothetical protein